MEQQKRTNRRTILQGAAALATLRAAGWGGDAMAAVADPAKRPIDVQALMAPGISEALAIERAGRIAELRYDIRLDVTGRDSATGTVRIDFTLGDAARDVVLDFRGPSIANLRINGVDAGAPDRRNGHVRLPRERLRKGANHVEAGFTTPIGPSGAALVSFDDPTDQTRYLYTVLVPADAHLLFPCFDQPDLKARVRWTITAPRDWTVIANSKLVTKSEQGATTVWAFNPTPPIPLYVASLAAGPWKAVSTGGPGERPITLYVRPSRASEIDVAPFVKANREAIAWLEQWLGMPYPFEKLDVVLTPAFPLGAMENIGAVFYGESIAIFREQPSLSQRLNRDQAIYHELSHQWFGDYVTMRWFDDLWLKEGFATFMSSYIQAALAPGTEPWKTAYVRLKPTAYNTDVSAGTTPLWQQLANLDEAGSNYGPIVYNKAPAVIRQLNFLVGDDAFRRGMQRYVRRHAYGNATWRDLLAALERASGRSLRTFGERYILQAGLPRVEVRLDLAGDRIGALSLAQRPANDKAGEGPWPMKLQLRLGYARGEDRIIPVMFDRDTMSVPQAKGLPAPDYVWANDGDYGYGLFMLDARSAGWLGEHIGEVKDNLLRAMLWGALWEEVRDCRLPPQRFAAIALAQLTREADEQVARFVLGQAATALTQYCSEAVSEPLFPAWEKLLAARAQNGSLSYGLRKDALDMLAACARTPAGLDVLRSYLDGGLTFDGKPVGQPSRWNMIGQLLTRDTPDATKRYEAEVSRDKSPDAARLAFITRAATADPAVKQEYFRRYIEDRTLNDGWVYPSFTNFNAPDQDRLTSPFLGPALEKLEWIKANRYIVILPTWINGFVKGRTSAADLATVDAYLAKRPDLAIDIRRKLLEARDDVARTVRIRACAERAGR